jgi:Outer membrane efflux protein
LNYVFCALIATHNVTSNSGQESKTLHYTIGEIGLHQHNIPNLRNKALITIVDGLAPDWPSAQLQRARHKSLMAAGTGTSEFRNGRLNASLIPEDESATTMMTRHPAATEHCARRGPLHSSKSLAVQTMTSMGCALMVCVLGWRWAAIVNGNDGRRWSRSSQIALGLLLVILGVRPQMAMAQDAPAASCKITLTSAVELALKQNLDLQIAHIETATRQQDRVIARSELFPQASLEADGSVNRHNIRALLGIQIAIVPQSIGPMT